MNTDYRARFPVRPAGLQRRCQDREVVQNLYLGSGGRSSAPQGEIEPEWTWLKVIAGTVGLLLALGALVALALLIGPFLPEGYLG